MASCHFSIILCLGFSSIAGALVQRESAKLGESSKWSNISAHVYVINAPTRRDKCECLWSQLESLKPPPKGFLGHGVRISRQNAVMGKKVAYKCPDMFQLWNRERIPNVDTIALVCSNYRIWERFLEFHHNEYLIILEDDVIIKAHDFWHKLHAILMENSDNTSACSNWDYMMVDPINADYCMPLKGSPEVDGCPRQCELSYEYSGSHMQIFKRSALQGLMNQTHESDVAAMDKHVFKVMLERPGLLRGVAGMYGLATQSRFWTPESWKPESCNASVWEERDRDPNGEQWHFRRNTRSVRDEEKLKFDDCGSAPGPVASVPLPPQPPLPSQQAENFSRAADVMTAADFLDAEDFTA